MSQDNSDYILRMILPYGSIIMLFILNVISFDFPPDRLLKIPLVLMAIYYWSIFRPRFIPPALTFFLGLMMDIMGGTPLGLNAMIFVLIQWIVGIQHRFLSSQSFVVVWGIFGFVYCMAIFIEWCVFSIMHLQIMPYEFLWGALAVGFFTFPVIFLLLRLVHKTMPGPI